MYIIFFLLDKDTGQLNQKLGLNCETVWKYATVLPPEIMLPIYLVLFLPKFVYPTVPAGVIPRASNEKVIYLYVINIYFVIIKCNIFLLYLMYLKLNLPYM